MIKWPGGATWPLFAASHKLWRALISSAVKVKA